MANNDYKVTFYTATILEWKPLLLNNIFKNIIINSLRYLVSAKKIKVYAFVIMPNHIHLIWQILDVNTSVVQHSFMKYTAQMLLKELRNTPELLKAYLVASKDRKYQIWERNPLHIFVENKLVFLQYCPKCFFIVYQKFYCRHISF